MTNFFYSGDREGRSRFGYRRFWFYGKDYGYNNTDCDVCHDIYDRRELYYVTTEENEYNNPDNISWTVKLCSGCLNSIIYEQDNHIFIRQLANNSVVKHQKSREWNYETKKHQKTTTVRMEKT